MNLETIKKSLETGNIYLSEEQILDKPTIIGYEKKFRWSWMAVQLNTFIVATDFGDEEVTPDLIEEHLSTSFAFAKKNYKGWPRGLQSGLGVISILISSNIDEAAKVYCQKLKSGKKWAAFTIPVTVNSATNEVYSFEKKPMWGRIFYPHFRRMIDGMA
ncbi:MAG: hypothetical protein GY810_26315 [Aureispira sp.]|nr:hypothetical protein [Aureispira sp.]